MRIAYVCADPGVPIFGTKGSSVHVRSVLEALVGLGARVELFVSRLGGPIPECLAHVPLHSLPRPAKGDPVARERAALAANAALARALAERGEFDLVYERYSLWSWAGMEHARATGAAGTLEVNAPLIDEQATHRTLVDRAGAEAVAARAFGAASALIAVSSGVAEWLERQTAARGRVRVVPNGVDPARFAARGPRRPARAEGDGGGFTVGFVGTLKPWHGLDLLVDAFARMHRARPQSRLLVVGDGPGRGELEADVRARGLTGAVTIAGAVGHDRVPDLLAAMDVAVAPYPDLQPFYFSPLKLFEYMAAGLPVVATRVGQVADVIEHGRTGLLCPPGNPAKLAAELEAVAAGPALGARLGAAARSAVCRRHSWDAAVREILDTAGLPPVEVAA